MSRHRASASPVPPLVLGLLGFLVSAWIFWPHGEPPAAGAQDTPRGSTTTSAPPVSASPRPTTGTTTSASPSGTPTDEASTDATPLDEAPPLLLGVADLLEVHFDSSSTADSGPLSALSTPEVTRLEDRGLPGSPGSDTVVIVGQDRYDDPDGAFNRLPDAVPGDEVVLRTQAGTLTYEVTEILDVAAADVLDHPLVEEEAPGRLVLVGIRYEPDGSRGDTDLVVVAELRDATTTG